MGKTEQVTCDGCGHDLTTRSNIEDYRLVLAAESKPGSGAGVYTCMAISPPVDRTFYFCGLDCLDHWRDREKHRNALSRDWWDQWTEKHGEKWNGGCSYPTPPDDVYKAAYAGFEEAALRKFPMERPNRR